jgi:hypothetical protein
MERGFRGEDLRCAREEAEEEGDVLLLRVE